MDAAGPSGYVGNFDWLRLSANAKPVAGAGPDLVASPGSELTLTGSFTDPDAGDTHTFSWQVKDAAGQPATDVITATSGTITGRADVRVLPTTPPVVTITGTSPEPEEPWVITRDTDVLAVITDPSRINFEWTLKAVPVGGGAGGEILSGKGNGAVGTEPDGGAVVGTIRPTLLASGLYKLVLTAGGTVAEQPFEVKTDLKLGNFALPVTDLTLAAPGGPPITVSRAYDTLRAGTDDGDYGYGWRLDASNTSLRTTATKDVWGTEQPPRRGRATSSTSPSRAAASRSSSSSPSRTTTRVSVRSPTSSPTLSLSPSTAATAS